MALLPTIPTSFVPHESVASRRDTHTDFVGAFSFISYLALGVVFLIAAGVFFYGRILDGTQVAKDAALAKAEAAIDPATVESFVQLRDRLNSSKTLLANHVALSGFFSALETLLPATVRFTSLHIALNTTNGAQIDGAGLAKSFNALSAASNSFAADGRIKDLIFSKISINKDNSVSFNFSAALDPSLIVYSASESTPTFAPPTPVATSTAASTSTKP